MLLLGVEAGESLAFVRVYLGFSNGKWWNERRDGVVWGGGGGGGCSLWFCGGLFGGKLAQEVGSITSQSTESETTTPSSTPVRLKSLTDIYAKCHMIIKKWTLTRLLHCNWNWINKGSYCLSSLKRLEIMPPAYFLFNQIRVLSSFVFLTLKGVGYSYFDPNSLLRLNSPR